MEFESLADKLQYLADSARAQAAPAANPGEEPAPGQRRWGEFAPSNPAQVVPIKDPATIVDKQINNFQAVGQSNYLAGIASPKADPIAEGIRAQPAYEAAMRDPAILKRRVTGLQRTSMQEWALAAETKGAARIVEGVTAARPKIERFWSSWHPILSQITTRVRGMPSITAADRDNRALTMMRELRGQKGRVRG